MAALRMPASCKLIVATSIGQLCPIQLRRMFAAVSGSASTNSESSSRSDRSTAPAVASPMRRRQRGPSCCSSVGGRLGDRGGRRLIAFGRPGPNRSNAATTGKPGQRRRRPAVSMIERPNSRLSGPSRSNPLRDWTSPPRASRRLAGVRLSAAVGETASAARYLISSALPTLPRQV